MLVNDILRRVQWAAGDSTGTLIDLTSICDLINDAQQDLNAEAKVVQTQANYNLVSGANSFTVNNAFQSILRVEGPDFLLQPIQYEQVIASDPLYGTANQKIGKPQYYWLGRRQSFAGAPSAGINVYPAADQAYTILLWAISIPTNVTLGTDTPALPEMFHPLIVRMCLAAVKEKDEDFEAAAFIRSDCLVRAAQLVGSALNPQEESYPVVRDYENMDRSYERWSSI